MLALSATVATKSTDSMELLPGYYQRLLRSVPMSFNRATAMASLLSAALLSALVGCSSAERTPPPLRKHVAAAAPGDVVLGSFGPAPAVQFGMVGGVLTAALANVRASMAGDSLRLTGIRAGELDVRTIALGRGAGAESEAGNASSLRGSAVIERSPGVREAFIPSSNGVEQRWILSSRPEGEGDWIVRVAVRGAGEPVVDEQGMLFTSPSGGKWRYGSATWIDSAGRREGVASRWVGDAIELRVPAYVLDHAQYPAALDPLIGPATDLTDPGAEQLPSTAARRRSGLERQSLARRVVRCRPSRLQHPRSARGSRRLAAGPLWHRPRPRARRDSSGRLVRRPLVGGLGGVDSRLPWQRGPDLARGHHPRLLAGVESNRPPAPAWLVASGWQPSEATCSPCSPTAQGIRNPADRRRRLVGELADDHRVGGVEHGPVGRGSGHRPICRGLLACLEHRSYQRGCRRNGHGCVSRHARIGRRIHRPGRHELRVTAPASSSRSPTAPERTGTRRPSDSTPRVIWWAAGSAARAARRPGRLERRVERVELLGRVGQRIVPGRPERGPRRHIRHLLDSSPVSVLDETPRTAVTLGDGAGDVLVLGTINGSMAARRMGADGNAVDASPFFVAGAANREEQPRIAFGNGLYLVVWDDYGATQKRPTATSGERWYAPMGRPSLPRGSRSAAPTLRSE